VICVLSVFALVASRDAVIQPFFFFQITIASFAATAAVHIWGALRGIQPRTETIETLAWLALVVVGLLCYPGAAPSVAG
jgi:hypothetical protein